jgi:hypothetical protein
MKYYNKIMASIFLLMFARTELLAEDIAEKKEFLTVAQQMRKEWKRLDSMQKSLSAADMQKIQDKAINWQKNSKPSSAIANYFVIRFIMTDDACKSDKLRLISSLPISMLPEGIDLIPLDKKDKNYKTYLRLHLYCLAMLIPNSGWQAYCDCLDTAQLNDINPSPPSVPLNNNKVMLQIAVEFEHAMLWNLAWKAYANAIYSSYRSPLSDKYCGWISSTTGHLWLKTAECAYKAGQNDIALEYLMKVAVFGPDDLQEMVSEKFILWSSKENINNKTIVVDNVARRQALTNVVKLYMEINAHPYALQILNEYKMCVDNPVNLQKQAENEWMAIIKHKVAAISDPHDLNNKIVFYGQEFYPKGNPVKIKIPWAFSDEAVASVRNRFKESISREPMPASSKKVETDK